MKAGRFQRWFELIFFLGVFLHELSHAAVVRAFGMRYDLHLTFFDDDISRSQVLSYDDPSTVVAVLLSVAPYSLLLLAVPMTVIVGSVLGLGSTIGLLSLLYCLFRGLESSLLRFHRKPISSLCSGRPESSMDDCGCSRGG